MRAVDKRVESRRSYESARPASRQRHQSAVYRSHGRIYGRRKSVSLARPKREETPRAEKRYFDGTATSRVFRRCISVIASRYSRLAMFAVTLVRRLANYTVQCRTTARARHHIPFSPVQSRSGLFSNKSGSRGSAENACGPAGGANSAARYRAASDRPFN